MARARALRALSLLMGWACVLIGIYHLVLGTAAIPGAHAPGATMDSWSRFMGANFSGYGAAWLWAARQHPLPARAVRWLAGIFLLGGAGRLISLAVHGWPQWFQILLSAIELALPPVYFWLADAEEKAAAAGPRRVEPPASAGGAGPAVAARRPGGG